MSKRLRRPRVPWLVVAATACLSLFQGPAALADDTPTPPPEIDASGRGLAVVVSGGVSQGAYQAGQLWLLDEFLRQKVWGDGSGKPLVLTGASAGSVNSLLLAVSQTLTHPSDEPPSESIFFRTWIPMGFSEDRESLDHWKPEDGLISSVAIEGLIRGLDHHWRTEYGQSSERAHREIYLGLQATRFIPSPERAPVAASPSGLGTFDPPYQTFDPPYQTNEAFAFQITAPADDAPFIGLRLTSLHLECSDPNAQDCAVRDMTLKPGEVPLSPQLAGQLVRASGAFPLAFTPVSVSCGDYRRAAFWPGRPCDDAQSLLLFDGGLYENNPVRLAYELTRTTSPDGQKRRYDSDQDRTYSFLYLDPDLRRSLWDAKAPPWEWTNISATDMGAQRAQVLRMFTETLRNQAVADFMRDYEDASEDNQQVGNTSLLAIPTRLPPSGAYLGAFLGFFDRSLRIWDFYAGIYDMRAALKDLGLQGSDAPSAALGRDPIFARLAGAIDAAAEDPCLNPRVWHPAADVAPPKHLWEQCIDKNTQVPTDPEKIRDRIDAIVEKFFPSWDEASKVEGLPANLDRLIDIPLVRATDGAPEAEPHACWGTSWTWDVSEASWAALRAQAHCPTSPEARDHARQAMYENLKFLTRLGLYRSAGALGDTKSGEADAAWFLDKLSDRDTFHPGDMAVTQRMDFEKAVQIQLLRLLERGFERGTLPTPEPVPSFLSRLNHPGRDSQDMISLRLRETLWPSQLEYGLEASADTTEGMQPSMALGLTYFCLYPGCRMPSPWLRLAPLSFSVGPEYRQGEGWGLATTWRPTLEWSPRLLGGGVEGILRPLALRIYPWGRYERLWGLELPGVQRVSYGTGVRIQVLQWLYASLEVRHFSYDRGVPASGDWQGPAEAPWRLSLGWVWPPDSSWRRNRRWPDARGTQPSP